MHAAAVPPRPSPATERLNFRIAEQGKDEVELAASLLRLSVSAFLRLAAEDAARSVIRRELAQVAA